MTLYIWTPEGSRAVIELLERKKQEKYATLSPSEKAQIANPEPEVYVF